MHSSKPNTNLTFEALPVHYFLLWWLVKDVKVPVPSGLYGQNHKNLHPRSQIDIASEAALANSHKQST